MAVDLTEDEKLDVCEICRVNIIELNHRLLWFEAKITPAVTDKVRALIERWKSGVGTDFVAVEPTTTNKGVSIDPNREKNDIRRTIANYLWITDLMTSTSNKIVRG
jgi:hypothetical protein